MTAWRCVHCAGSLEPGWVCADHPDKPWGHDGCGAEAARCVCNPTGAVDRGLRRAAARTGRAGALKCWSMSS